VKPSLLLGATLFLTAPMPAPAGCSGPVLTGVCQGTAGPWQTHPHPPYPPQAAPGWHREKRHTRTRRDPPAWRNPWTGKDAHAPDWVSPERR